MSKNNSLKIQSLSLFVGKVLAFIVQFITPIILVRILTKTDYGIYQQFHLFAGLLLPVLGLCLNTSLFYFYPVSEQEDRKAYIIQTFFILSFVGIAFLIISLNYHHFIFNIFSLPELDRYRYIIPLYILFMLVSSISDFLFILEKKIKFNIFYYPVEMLIRLVLILGFLFSTKNTWGCLMGLLVYSFIRFLFISIYLAIKYLNNIKHIVSKIKSGSVIEQLKYSLPFVGGVLLETITRKFDKILLNKYIEPSQYAIYAVAFFSIPLVTMLFASINDVVVPEISRYAHADNKKKAAELWHKVIEKTSSVAIPSIFFFSIMAEEVIVLLYTKNYAESAIYYRIYLLSFLFTMTSFGLVLRGFKKTIFFFRANLIGAIVTISIGYFLIKNFLIMGAMITAIIGIGVPIIIVIYYEKKLLNLTFSNWMPWDKIVKIALITILASLIILPIKIMQINNILTLLITGVIYFPIIVFMEYRLNLFIYPDVLNKYFKVRKITA
jgi:O-antigen/teichoic acid export membrane protein